MSERSSKRGNNGDGTPGGGFSAEELAAAAIVEGVGVRVRPLFDAHRKASSSLGLLFTVAPDGCSHSLC